MDARLVESCLRLLFPVQVFCSIPQESQFSITSVQRAYTEWIGFSQAAVTMYEHRLNGFWTSPVIRPVFGQEAVRLHFD